jgi:hypothetical protein
MRQKDNTKERRCLFLRKSTRVKQRVLLRMLPPEAGVESMSDVTDLAVDYVYKKYTGAGNDG